MNPQVSSSASLDMAPSLNMRGTDVVKALALGARAVLIGRPIFWGLAVDGAAGLQRLMAILREEMEGAMALCGRPTIASLDPSLVTRMPPL